MEFEGAGYELDQGRIYDSGGLESPERITVVKATSAKAKRKGLLEREGISQGTGLYLPCATLIHMIGMRFALDCVFLSSDGRVRHVAYDVQPGFRFRGSLRGPHCLELAAGEARRLGLAPGARVAFGAE